MYMTLYTYTQMHVHTCTHAHEYINMHTHTNICTHTHIYTQIYYVYLVWNIKSSATNHIQAYLQDVGSLTKHADTHYLLMHMYRTWDP